MNVSLTPTLENFVKSRVKTGLYGNASEVVREALRLMLEQEEFKANQQKLFTELDKGYKDYQEGRHRKITPNEIFENVLAKRKKK